MKMAELKNKAKTLGLKIPFTMNKIEVIKAIQRKEGNFDCFATASIFCDQYNCLFRHDCLSLAK